MQKKPLARKSSEGQQRTLLETAHAEALALREIYRETLTSFFSSPNSVPLPRAARAMHWLGRLRQWRAIDIAGTGVGGVTNWTALQLGVVEALAGAHALALHQETWSGPKRRQTYERDMALLIAMLIAMDWKPLAAFALRNWFGTENHAAQRHPTSGIAGMILTIAGAALGIGVAPAAFQRSDALLARMVARWRDNETVFVQLMFDLADRHVMQCRLDTDKVLYDFDHPLEQAIPVEVLMLLRLRGNDEVPDWLRSHPACQHPAAMLIDAAPPVVSQRCQNFIDATATLLPQYLDLQGAFTEQSAQLQCA